jgi:pantoate--beta-alanine ligase
VKIYRTILEMQNASRAVRNEGREIGFTPTMGYLHEGHLSLVREAKKKDQNVGVSIYVNPTQFCPGEDFERYPREEARDFTLLEKENVDWIFLPSNEEIYPDGFSTYIEPPSSSRGWCGDSRPGHFRGVCTIIAILLNIVRPTRMYLGQKDAQQAAVIRRLVKDLRFGTDIVVCPTVRESDGLAMSSRNTYLSYEERRSALILYETLLNGIECYHGGECDAEMILLKGAEKIKAVPEVKPDYLGIVHPDTFQSVKTIEDGNLYIGSIYIGKTRLIDNMIFQREG